jgi:hypothetical protein
MAGSLPLTTTAREHGMPLACPFCDGVLDARLTAAVCPGHAGRPHCTMLHIHIDCPHCHLVLWSRDNHPQFFDPNDAATSISFFYGEFAREMLQRSRGRWPLPGDVPWYGKTLFDPVLSRVDSLPPDPTHT